jgi:hypothetical protein
MGYEEDLKVLRVVGHSRPALESNEPLKECGR